MKKNFEKKSGRGSGKNRNAPGAYFHDFTKRLLEHALRYTKSCIIRIKNFFPKTFFQKKILKKNFEKKILKKKFEKKIFKKNFSKTFSKKNFSKTFFKNFFQKNPGAKIHL